MGKGDSSINGTGIAAQPHGKKKTTQKTVTRKTTNYIQTIYVSQKVTQNYHKFSVKIQNCKRYRNSWSPWVW